jgi:flagellar protein FlbD
MARFLIEALAEHAVITLTRLNGNTVAINPDLVTVIEVTPDTTLCFLNGDRIIVRQTLDEVIAKVIEFRQTVGRTTSPLEILAAARGEESSNTGASPIRRTPNREG